jgi:hypothetical protein
MRTKSQLHNCVVRNISVIGGRRSAVILADVTNFSRKAKKSRKKFREAEKKNESNCNASQDNCGKMI